MISQSKALLVPSLWNFGEFFFFDKFFIFSSKIIESDQNLVGFKDVLLLYHLSDNLYHICC